MNKRLIAVSGPFCVALQRYVTAPSRLQLHEALLLGQQVVTRGLETVDLATIRQRTLLR